MKLSVCLEVMDAHLQNNQTAEDNILASPDRLKGKTDDDPKHLMLRRSRPFTSCDCMREYPTFCRLLMVSNGYGLQSKTADKETCCHRDL